MAQQVKLRRSSVAGNKPTTSQLELGELAINTNDGKLYFEKSSSLGESVQEIIVTDAWNTGSLNISGSVTISGSIIANSFTGSILGTASYANSALSASYTLTASYFSGSIPLATTSSYSITASYALAVSGSGVVGDISGNATNITAFTIDQDLGVSDQVSFGGVTASFLGNLTGTASYASNALSASYSLTSISASYALSASYAATSSYAKNIVISGSINNVDYIDFNTGSATPAWKSGRVYWDNTDGALAVYNAEQDITLQVGQENWVRVFNASGVLITDGTPVKLVGSHGDVPEIQLAQSVQVSGSIERNNQILGLATHDIEINTIGYVTVEGIVRGLNTNVFNDGDRLFVSSSAGKLTNIPPPAPYEVIPVGVVVKAGPGGSGIIYVSTQQPIDFSDLSSVVVSGSYHYGDLWVYRPSGSTGVWEHTNQLSGSYGLTGSLNATSFTGSLLGTASYVATASYIPTLQQVTNQGSTTTTAITSSGLYVNGNAIISGNLNVLGTASFANVTSSVVIVGDNTIILNTDAPSVRYGGIEVIDSGSFGNSSTGSLLWDSEKNRWIYANPSGSTYDGGLLISGPRNTTGLGNEEGTTLNAILKGQGGDHLTSSAIIENGTSTNFYSNAAIITSAGSVTATSFTGSLLGTSSYASNALSASYALTSTSASYALNTTSASYALSASYAPDITFPYTGSARITGSLNVIGSTTITGSVAISGSISNPGPDPSRSNEIFGVGAYPLLTGPARQTTVMGAYALGSSTGIRDSVVIGYAAMFLTTGSAVTGSIAIGQNALYNQQGGLYNIAIGLNAMQGLTGIANTGDRNLAIGTSALLRNTTGTRNNSIGDSSLSNNSVGNYNTANGNRALQSNTSGSYNVALGYDALNAQTSASNNTALGTQALRDVTTGANNVAIGYDSGRGITTGQYNTILGANVIGLAAGLSNNVIIADSQGNIRAQHDASTWSFRTSATITGSLEVSTGITGSLFGTSSYATQALSSSFATTAISASYFSGSVSNAISSSYATTASFATTALSASYFSGSLSAPGSTTQVLYNNGGTVAGDSGLVYSGSRVGIGTTSPATKLQVNGTFASNALWTDATSVAYWGSYPTIYGGLTWDTGYAMIFATTGNALRFATNGSGASMTIDTSGNVGIGLTNPAYKLDIAGTTRITDSGYAGIEYHNTAGTWEGYIGTEQSAGNLRYNSRLGNHTWYSSSIAIMKLTSAGNLGIGTTNPGQKLQVEGSLLVNAGTSATSYRDIMIGGIGGWDNGESHGIDTVYNTASSPTTFSRIESYYDGTNGKIRFRNLYNAGAPRTDILMTIQGNGNVGIGTDSPADKLYVSSSGFNVSTFDSSYGQMAISFANNGTIFSQLGSGNSVTPTGAANDLGLGTAGLANNIIFATGTSYLERMRITSGGNVGIGSTSPSDKLEVVASTYNGITITTPDVTTLKMRSSGGGTKNWGFATTNLAASDFGIYESTSAGGDPINAGTARLYFKTGGTVGIGTTNTTQYSSLFPAQLVVNAGSAVDGIFSTTNDSSAAELVLFKKNPTNGFGSLLIQHSGSSGRAIELNYGVNMSTGVGGTTSYFVNTNGSGYYAGNLGIGITNPSKKLHIKGGDDDVLFLDNGGQQYTTQYFANNGTTKAFLGWDNTNSIYIIGTAVSSDFYFSTNNTERMRITSGGNVGIGLTSPQKVLDVLSGANNFTTAGADNLSVGQWAGVHFGYRENNTDYRKSAIVFERTDLTSNNAQGKVHILNGPQAGAGSATLADAKLTINEAGNVGIGTTNPLYKLESSTTALFGTTAYGVLNIAGDNPAYIKIKTNIPFSYGNQAYTVNIKGFQYGSAQTLDLQICWHQYIDLFTSPTITSKGSFAPVVRLARENGLVVIVLTWGQYWPKLYVEAVNNYINDGYANGWSWVDENVTGDKTVTLSYKNDFGDNFVKTAAGLVGIGTTSPAAKLDIKGDLIVSSSLIVNQNTASLASGARTISTNATSSYTAAFFNYTVASGSNARAGQVTAVWNGGSIQYTDVSTTDIGSTLGVAFTASLSGANVQLTTVLPTSGWTVKTLVNLI